MCCPYRSLFSRLECFLLINRNALLYLLLSLSDEAAAHGLPHIVKEDAVREESISRLDEEGRSGNARLDTLRDEEAQLLEEEDQQEGRESARPGGPLLRGEFVCSCLLP